jgi:hypothetical protein
MEGATLREAKERERILTSITSHSQDKTDAVGRASQAACDCTQEAGKTTERHLAAQFKRPLTPRRAITPCNKPLGKVFLTPYLEAGSPGIET